MEPESLPLPMRYKSRLPLRPLLKALCNIYLTALKTRELLYQKGFFRSKRAPCFVLSVGNLALGGSGKTPTTILISQWAKEKGYKVAVVSRGYKGSKSGKRPIVVSDGKRLFWRPREVGDEPYMMAKRLLGIPVLICKSRYNACVLAKERFGAEVIVLDDGFQHLALQRDLNLLVLRSITLNEELFPLGNLREPISSVRRADVLLVILDDLKDSSPINIPSMFTGPVFYGRQIPHIVYFANENREVGLGFLEKKDLVAFTGIASPQRFLNSLLNLKANVVKFYTFQDHHYFSPKEVQRIKKDLGKHGYLITTEKDWARLEELKHLLGPELLVLSTQIHIERAHDFFELIEKAISGAFKDERSFA